MSRLDGKAALITGAGRGIGRALALRFAEAGAALTLCGRSAENLEATRMALEPEARERCLAVPTDIARYEELQAAVEATIERHGRLDVVVNNAGVGHRAPFATFPPAEYDRLIAVNVGGTLHGCLAAWGPMRAAGGGVILNISSLVTRYPTRELAVYTATKAFVDGITASLGDEGRRHGIHVCGLAPGFVDTEMLEAMTPEAPERRRLDPVDVAEAALELCTPPFRVDPGQVYSLRR